MEIPTEERKLSNWAQDTIAKCMVSRENRGIAGRKWRQLFYTSSMGAAASKHPRCYDHIDKLTSFLFSAEDVRFTIDFDDAALPQWSGIAERVRLELRKAFRKGGVGETFATAVESSLVEGTAIIKMTWDPRTKKLKPWVITQSYFGVYREDIERLEDQEAFCHSYFVTPEVFQRMIWQHPDRDALMFLAKGSATLRGPDELTGDSYFHEIVSGGPLAVQGMTARQNYGAVSITVPQGPMLAAEVAADLIRIDDLWAWNDRISDWTTIRHVDPGIIIEGRLQHRNMSDAPKRHPFIKVCSNKVTNFFWGRPELANVLENQILINRRVDNVDGIFELQAKPPRSFSGFQGMTDERARAMLMPGGTVVEGAVGAEVKNLAPTMPDNWLEYLDKLDDYFDQSAGFTNILSGQGEPGVRAGVHAGVLLRTSTPRLRDRALLVENQCAQVAELCLDIKIAKDAKVYYTAPDDQGKRQEFMLSAIPDDHEVEVDSHSSSPAFTEDNRQDAFAMFKAQAIDGEDLIDALNPPRAETLKTRYRERAAAQAAFLQQHPELAEKGKK